MNESRDTAAEALRILRSIRTSFSDGSQRSGSAFVGSDPGTVITCAHVVSESGLSLTKLTVGLAEGRIRVVYPDIDLAIIDCAETEVSQTGDASTLSIGDSVMFAGIPVGVSGPSVFAGMLSARGKGMLDFPRCELLQINGMINSGNSGGPVFLSGGTSVVGVITAKFVPLLQEIDKLRGILKQIPQVPSAVGIGGIDFAKFFNLTVGALGSISGSLRLVQVGTGYAVPIDLLPQQ